MDFDILYAIQSIRTPFLDDLILLLTKVTGNYGQIWLALAVILLLFRKTRVCGVRIILSYALVYVLGQMLLKDLIARPRPCHLDETIELLVSRPGSYSCPSTHTAWAFAAATSIFLRFKKWGIALFVVAAVIGFSRLYLFMHFPTDVLFGAVLGAAFAVGTYYAVNAVTKKFEKSAVSEESES